MTNARDLTYGIAIGAGLMFLFDPRRGAARRAVIRQKATRAAHEVETAAGIGARDLEHRAEGMAARLTSFIQGHESDVLDDVLVARVRAELGRVCSHPRAIEVLAKGDGHIELKGPILRADVDRVLGTIKHVPGVKTIDDDLEVHPQPDNHPALQGPAMRSKPRLLASPAARFIVGIGGAGACVTSLIKGNTLGLIVGGAILVGSAHSIVSHRGRRPLLPRRPIRGLREAYPTGSEWAPAPAEQRA
jgi:hypothetical protein